MLETQRLILREYHSDDYQYFYQMNSSPKVMEFFPTTLTQEDSNHVMDRLNLEIQQNGYGFWAVEEKSSQELIGFVGLNKPRYQLPKENCTEIGWRLREEFWGQGYAPEAAHQCLDFAFNQLGLDEVVAFTPVNNTNSRRVMEKIGMKNLLMNFQHPLVDPQSKICEHVFYSIQANL